MTAVARPADQELPAPPLSGRVRPFRLGTALLDRLGCVLLDGPLLPVLAGLLLLVIVKDGVSHTPNIYTWVVIAQAFPAQPHLPAIGRYLLSSPIGPATAHVLGLDTPFTFIVLHVAVAVTGGTILVVGLLHRGGRQAAGLGAVLFLASPLSDVLLSGIGMQDAWLFAAFCALVLFDRPVVLGIAAAIAALAHPDMALLTVAAIAALRLVDPRGSRPFHQVAAMSAGVVIGALGTFTWEVHAGGGALPDGSFIGQYGLGAIAGDWLHAAAAWTWSAFGAAWLFVFVVAHSTWHRRAGIVTLIAVAVSTAMSVITLDETRIFALLTWPLLLWWLRRAVHLLPASRLRLLVAALFVLALSVPNVVVWMGHLTS
jgi:hypothetical protein